MALAARAARPAGWIRPLGSDNAAYVNFGALSAAGRRDSGAAARPRFSSPPARGPHRLKVAVPGCSIAGAEVQSKVAPPAGRPAGPFRRRRDHAARPSRLRFAHRAHREARVALAAMQVPRVPVQHRHEARQPARGLVGRRVLHREESRPFPGRQLRHPDPVLAGEHAAVVGFHWRPSGRRRRKLGGELGPAGAPASRRPLGR